MRDNHKPRLLYIMGIDWGWIYQRPQIIETHLEKKYDVTVIFPRSILKLFSKCHTNYPLNYKILWTLPLQEKNAFIGKLSRLLNNHLFKDIDSYETVVIGYPLYYRYLSKQYHGTLIYDCMDNYETLYCYPAGVSELLHQEKQLLSQSNLVFTGSQMLQEKLKGYGINTLPPMVLLRNGTNIPEILPPISRPAQQSRYRIGYIGTIAEWFDLRLIQDSLRQQEDIEYHLIGPISIPLPEHARIIWEGIVAHELLYDTAKSCCCLIMPFLLEETVLYVDPVKLYEYIVMGKCIISVYYPEIERFKAFVYFYNNTSEYIQLLSALKRKGFPPKYTALRRQAFLSENSWQCRFSVWDDAVNSIGQDDQKTTLYKGSKEE